MGKPGLILDLVAMDPSEAINRDGPVRRRCCVGVFLHTVYRYLVLYVM
jgi:hypothetical protein